MKLTTKTTEQLARAKFGDSFIHVRYFRDRLSKLAGETHEILIDTAPYGYDGTSWMEVCQKAGLI